MSRIVAYNESRFRINAIRVKAFLCLLAFVGLGIFGYLIANNLKIGVSAVENDVAENTINPAYTTEQNLRLLVVEINPDLSGGTKLNSERFNPRADSRIEDRAGAFFFQEYVDAYPVERQKVNNMEHGIAGISVNEQIDDLEFASHGYLNIEVVDWLHVNDFPHYMNAFKLPNGECAFAFDEENYLAAMGGKTGTSAWYQLLNDGWFSGGSTNEVCDETSSDPLPPRDYDFDYAWLLEEMLDENDKTIIDRRNNGEFDMLWIVSTDPSKTYEDVMVGRMGEVYNLNGTLHSADGSPRYVDCDMFWVGGASMSRRDSQLHALAHAMENIMGGRNGGGDDGKGVYPLRYDSYSKAEDNQSTSRPPFNVSTAEEYMDLNLWERFILNDYANLGTLNGVGNVHFPYNGTSGYDYDNNSMVNTTYSEWMNGTIDEMDGSFTSANSSVWLDENSIFYVSDFADHDHMMNPSQADDRFYSRFWMYLFPHETGYTVDGYLKNWWKYIYSLNYVKNLSAANTNVQVTVGDEFTLEYVATYRSNDEESGVVDGSGDNVHIADSSVVDFRDGKFKALQNGSTTVTLYRDGKSVEYAIGVAQAPDPIPTTYVITTGVNPVGSGVVTGAISGESYEENTQLTLVAAPSDDKVWEFSRWLEDGSTVNPRIINVVGDATYTAVFVKKQYTITVKTTDDSVEMGTVSINNGAASSSVAEQFEYNAEVRINALPNAGYVVRDQQVYGGS